MVMQATCAISGQDFTVSAHELELRSKFGFGATLPPVKPKYRFQEVGAFWPHWNFHKRICSKTGRSIISIFRPECAYPVWHRDEWVAHANPPSQEIDFSKDFFEQAWEVFKASPIPHAFQSNNQNCEYTDDWYYSKNCYLCHGGQNNEDARYCYACDSLKNVQYALFSFNSELCTDLINSSYCFNSLYLVNCKNVYDSAFLYDCRDCSDCLFCFNLRNKKYCFGNQQLSKEEYEEKKKEWNFSSFKNYEEARKVFREMMKTVAWHRSLQIDLCENSTGNFIRNSKNCENCYLLSNHEDCANVAVSGPNARTILDSIGTVGAELAFMCSLPVYSYMARFSFSVSHCRFVDYSAYLENCQYCFGCCGLFNARYCIFNKQYSEEEYKLLVPKLIEHMQKTGEWGRFFPLHFAPNPYEESFSGLHFPTTEKRTLREIQKTAEVAEIPDSIFSLGENDLKLLTAKIFWDEEFQRPFQIQSEDVKQSKERRVPLPHSYYANHMHQNLEWMPFQGELRNTICAKSRLPIQTYWPTDYDGRILSEEEYLKIIK
jgi:hypothetical protein